MNANELIPMLIYGGIAFGLACSMVLVQAVVMDTETRIGRWLLPMVLPLITLAICINTALSGRSLKYAGMDIRLISGMERGGGGSLMRMITATLLAISFAKILNIWIRSRQHGASKPDPAGRGLFLCFLAYFIANVVLASAFGAKPSFVHNTLYPVVVFSAVFMARNEPLGPVLNSLKISLLLMMLGSLALAAIKPDLALQPNYRGWIPGLTIRLWGLGSNANSIGPLALMLLLLEVAQPSRSRMFKSVLWMTGLVVLLLSQSKTVWGAALVVGTVVTWYRHGRREGGGIKIGFALMMIIVLIVAALGLMFIDIDRILLKLSLTQAGGDISTLTGRAQIWAAAVDTWLANPVFGYGIEAWEPLHRAILGMPYAFHAHNQLLQSLSVAGTFGGLTLLAYVIALIIASWRAAERTRGVSLGLMAFILIRCLPEAPLELGGLFSGEILMHLLLFLVVINTSPLMASEERR